MKLLIAEDSPLIGAAMEQGLRMAGFEVSWARDGKAAEAALQGEHFDLLILDLGLPQLDGLSLLKHLRQADNPLPVLIVTARDAISDRVTGLNAGADDYLIKPFDLNELVARTHALLRRQSGRAKPELCLGGLCLNPLSHEARLDGRELKLSQREFTLLLALLEKPGAVLSKDQLEQRLYGWEEGVLSNTVEVYLHHLRKKLGVEWIRNVRGVGYKIVLPSA